MKLNKKHIKLTVILSLSILSMISCSDEFFDKNPLDAISDATFWKTEDDAKLALVGCYRAGSGWSGEDFWGVPRGQLYLDLMAGLGSEKELIPDQVTNGNLTSAYWVTEAYWRNAYSKITTCNNFLNQVTDIEMDGDLKNMMIAEVKTIRAFIYLNLGIYYGDVPLLTEVLTIAEANAVTQSDRQVVFDFVETELDASIPNLPATRAQSENGRLTSGAALAILGRAQLFREDWDGAVSTYASIVNGGNYSLNSSYQELFWEASEFSNEIILSSQYLEDTYGHVMLQYLYPETWGGWHQFSPYNELVKSYECIDGNSIEDSPLYNPDSPYDNRDPRLDYTILISDRSVFKGTTYVSRPDSNSPDRFNKYNWSGYCISKFMDSGFEGNLMNYGGNWIMIRYAEVLLSYLEANYRAGNTITQAMLDDTINLVRSRMDVNMPDITVDRVSELGDLIMNERKVELAFEGLRYFDILRWDIASEELNRQFTGMKLTTDPSNYTDFSVDDDGYFIYQTRNFKEGVNELWPIPLSEMEINSNLVQNPGY